MAFSNGVFSLNSSYNPVVTGATIQSAWANTTLNEIATGLSTCILKDGTQTLSANIPMGGYKLTGLAAGASAGDSVRYEQAFIINVAAAGNLLFVDATYDIGASGATRPKNLWMSGNATIGGTASVAGTAGAPGAATGILGGNTLRGLELTGSGSTNDVTLLNKNGQTALGVTTGTQNVVAAGTLTGTGAMLSPITATLAADVAMNNSSVYFNGPSVAQGSTGNWFVSGTVTLKDTAGSALFDAKLWDGTTVVASCRTFVNAINQLTSASLSGYIAAPAGNLRIDAKDVSSTSGVIIFNASTNAKDSTISAIRVA